MRLHALGGMCNRLRAILGHMPTMVLWDVDDAAVHHTHFLDVFEPIPGVEFTTDRHFDVEAWAPPVGAKLDWSLIKPKAKIRERILELVSIIKQPYAAMHIRRTDHRVLAERAGVYTTDAEFLGWAAHFSHVYLATDNGETQRLFRHAFINRTLHNPAYQDEFDRTKAGTLADAVVDLYMCVLAEHFMGSKYSTFTETIQEMRRDASR